MPTPPVREPIADIAVATEPLADDRLRHIAERMLVARTLDVAAVRWQRQGLLPAYPPAFGQEAAQVGSASALERRDFAFITYRDHGVVVGLDADLTSYMASHLGVWNGGMADPAELTVDATHHLLDLATHLLVVLDAFAAGGRELDERDVLGLDPSFLQQFVERLQA